MEDYCINIFKGGEKSLRNCRSTGSVSISPAIKLLAEFKSRLFRRQLANTWKVNCIGLQFTSCQINLISCFERVN